MASPLFDDRADAGRQLAAAVARLELHDPVVLALPRGGVPVAEQVAAALGAPLDVLIVRKIGAPGQREFGVGAIGEDGTEVLDGRTLERLGLTREDLVPIIEEERAVLAARVATYRGDAPGVEVRGRDCVVVDDGLATGVSAAVAVAVLRRRAPSRIVLAVPVAPPAGVQRLEPLVDRVVALHTPRAFRAVGSYYRDFSQ